MSIEGPQSGFGGSTGAMVRDVPGQVGGSVWDSFAGLWWLVYTKPRNEKALAEDLERMGIGCFLPLARVRRRYSGRSVEATIPLFPSYLFFRGGEDQRLVSLRTNRVVRVIRVVEQERLEEDLRNIHLACRSDQPVDLYPGLRSGQRCRVVSGSLQGMEGVVLRRRGLCRVYVGVEVLGQSAELEIDPSLLEVIQ